jgi:hypothetical protein
MTPHYSAQVWEIPEIEIPAKYFKKANLAIQPAGQH